MRSFKITSHALFTYSYVNEGILAMWVARWKLWTSWCSSIVNLEAILYWKLATSIVFLIAGNIDGIGAN